MAMLRGTRIEDEMGKVYGHLTVVGLVAPVDKRAMWLCACLCGNHSVAVGKNLRRGLTRSCGCQQYENRGFDMTRFNEDLTGLKFGRLVVLKKVKNGTRSTWLCKCDCENEITLPTSLLKYRPEYPRECLGCQLKTIETVAISNARNALLLRYQKSAKERNLEWNLPFDLFHLMLKQDCVYCGLPPKQEFRSASRIYFYNGIDRVDSNLGYVSTNVVSCCKLCNFNKRTQSLPEFTSWIRAVYARLPSE